MGALQPMHLAVILLIVLIVFGPGKLTDIGGQLGRGLREFRDASAGERSCPSCHAAITAEGAFCPSCGARLTEPAK